MQEQIPPGRAQLVLDARGHLQIHRAHHQPVPLQPSQRLGKHLLAHTLDFLEKARETEPSARAKDVDDPDRPLVRDVVEDLPRQAFLALFECVASTHGGLRSVDGFHLVSIAPRGAYLPLETSTPIVPHWAVCTLPNA